MAGISEEEFLRRKRERLAAKANNMTPNTDNGVSKEPEQPEQALNASNSPRASSFGKNKLIIIVAAAILIIGSIITIVMVMNHQNDVPPDANSDSDDNGAMEPAVRDNMQTANEDPVIELDEEEMEDHQDYLDSLKEEEEKKEREQAERQRLLDGPKQPTAPEKAAQLVFVRDITYKKQKKPSWLIFKDQKNRFCAVVTSSKYQILQETNYCIPFSGKDEDLKDSFAGNSIAEIDYPEHKQCKNVNTKSDNPYCNDFYQAFIRMAERENFVKLKELCQSDKSLIDVCKYLD